MKQGIAARLLLGFIRVYQFTLSTVMGKQCRYHPTCSYYTADAVKKFGAARGAWLGARRICRCHPWNPGGYDPVPEKFNFFSENPCGCDKKPQH
ncbi:MAG: membrane protein insertion efficiency factor YidD [Micavibrio sp.]|nr:membrane protein insertion efficiency factor YidD [Micavibrio sp.]